MGLTVFLHHHHYPLPHQHWAHCSPSGFHAILATGLTWPSLATGSLIATMTTTMMVMICEWGDKHGVGVDEYWWCWWWQLYRWGRWTRKPEEINGFGARFLTICCFVPLVEIILSKIKHWKRKAWFISIAYTLHKLHSCHRCHKTKRRTESLSEGLGLLLVLLWLILVTT